MFLLRHIASKFPQFLCMYQIFYRLFFKLNQSQFMHKFRTFARLGEYDTSTLTDGKHEDINIAQKIVHEEWSLGLLINDIAILGLVRDVTFNGTNISNEIFNWWLTIIFIFDLDRIVPICLPKKKNHLSAIFTKSLVGLNPFIGNVYRLICFHFILVLWDILIVMGLKFEWIVFKETL